MAISFGPMPTRRRPGGGGTALPGLCPGAGQDGRVTFRGHFTHLESARRSSALGLSVRMPYLTARSEILSIWAGVVAAAPKVW